MLETRVARIVPGAAQPEPVNNAIYDLKSHNPTAQSEGHTPTPAELLKGIEASGKEVAEAPAP